MRDPNDFPFPIVGENPYGPLPPVDTERVTVLGRTVVVGQLIIKTKDGFMCFGDAPRPGDEDKFISVQGPSAEVSGTSDTTPDGVTKVFAFTPPILKAYSVTIDGVPIPDFVIKNGRLELGDSIPAPTSEQVISADYYPRP